jgi:hypothetical protein
MLSDLIIFTEHVHWPLDPTKTNTTKNPKSKEELKALCSFTNFVFMLVPIHFWPFNYPNYSNSKYNPSYPQGL